MYIDYHDNGEMGLRSPFMVLGPMMHIISTKRMKTGVGVATFALVVFILCD